MARLILLYQILELYDINLGTVLFEQFDEVFSAEPNSGGVVVGVGANHLGGGVYEMFVEIKLNEALLVVKEAEWRDGARREVEDFFHVFSGGKTKVAGALLFLELFEVDAFFVEHSDEVIVALLVVADEEIFGASVRIKDFDIFAIANMKKWLMFGELEFNIFVPEELANFSLVH